MQRNKDLFRINVGFLLNQPVGTFREFDIQTQELDIDDDFHLDNFVGTVRLNRVQQGILVNMKCAGDTALDCVRCLTPFIGRLSTEFDELFALPNLRQNADADNFLPENGNIDLFPLIDEYMTMEIPIKPICSEDCKGLCQECGANLNIETCEHHHPVMKE